MFDHLEDMVKHNHPEYAFTNHDHGGHLLLWLFVIIALVSR